MEDRQESAIAAYDLAVRKRYRSRGGWMLETNTGLKLLREYETISGHFAVENEIKDFLVQQGFTQVDQVIPNREGMLVTELESGEKYVLYQWFAGEECNLKEINCLMAAGENLGKLHKMLSDYHRKQEEPQEKAEQQEERWELLDQFQKHNRELKRVNGYLKNKKRKNEFEIYAINCFKDYYEKACEAAERLENCAFYKQIQEGDGEVCHGDYNYHNLVMTRSGVATTGFEKSGTGIQLLDLTYFMRKTLEKNGWRREAGEAVLKGYQKENPLKEEQLEFVYIVLLYPEKYWKLMNHYYNKKKSWLSAKSLEKLKDVRSLEKNRENFLRLKLK